MVSDPETLEKIDLYRNSGTGRLIGRDPDSGDKFPIPFEEIESQIINALGNLNFENSDSIQDTGSDAIQFDGSQNVTIPNGGLDIIELTDNASNTISDFTGSNLTVSSGTLNAAVTGSPIFQNRVDVTSTSTTLSPADSAWVDTSAAGGAVTITLPADGDTSDGDRVEVGVEDATNDTDVTANTGQSIIGNNPTLTQIGDTLTLEYKASTSTWMVK